MNDKQAPTTVDEYIAQFTEDVQQVLHQIRTAIKAAAPEAVEKISYQMPGYFQDGALVWYGAYKHHIGFYPTSTEMKAALPELTVYKGTKGSVHFPLDQPMPLDLIRGMVKFRLAENQKQA